MVQALPEGGQIVGGAANGTINQPTPQDLTINQNNNNLIINWQGFNIGGSESVQFFQPGIDSVALNRVVGADPSRIAGRLTANGQVFISNPSGVIFLPGSQVDVHGLLATTLSISDQDFLDRNYRFFQDPTRSLASILNEGAINGSYVGLLAPSVTNRGSIIANLGSVALGSGKAATLDFIGDDLINFAITEPVEGTATDAEGNVIDSNISNEGLIRADGGQVSLSVKRAGEIIKNVINQEGMIEARTVVEKEGRIYLSGGESGIVNISGNLDASGRDEGEKGGTVQVTGEKVGLFEDALVDVSGDKGGGTALIGGDFQGQGEIPAAFATFIGKNSSIAADAITSGDGGTIIVWADDTAKIHGNLSARGGSESGDGGFIETSGLVSFEILNAADVSAPNGNGGEWLIDPGNIGIVSGSGSFSIGNTNPFISSGNASLGVNLIVGALTGGANVTVQTGLTGSGAGNISLLTTLDYNGTGSNRLTFRAINDITLFQSILDTNTSSSSIDSLRISLLADTDLSGSGDVIVGSGVTVNTEGGLLSIQANDVNLAGNLNSGDGPTSISVLAGADIGIGGPVLVGTGDTLNICAGLPCGMSITGEELSHINANTLEIGTDGFTTLSADVYVDGVSAANSNNIGTLRIISGFSDDSITFLNNPSTFNRLTARANGSINVNTDLTTDTGDLVLFADLDNFPGGGNVLRFTGSRNITSAGEIELSAPTGGISANDTMIFNADGGITINDDFTSSGFILFGADFDGDGNGPFTLASGATVSVAGAAFADAISIGASDVILLGNLETARSSSQFSLITIGHFYSSSTLGIAGAGVDTSTLCGGVQCGMTLTSDELSRISTELLWIGGTIASIPITTEMFVDNISAADTATFDELVLNSAGSLHFVNNPSTFGSSLFASAFGDINVNVDLAFQKVGDFSIGTGLFPTGVKGTAGFLFADYSQAITGRTDVIGDGIGDINIASGATVSTTGFDLWLKGNDIDLQGAINSGAGKVYLMASDNETFGIAGLGVDVNTLCGGAQCGMTLDDSEVLNITASGLEIGRDPFNMVFWNTESDDIFINGVAPAGLANAGSLTLNALSDGASIRIDGEVEFLEDVFISADRDIRIFGDFSVADDLFLIAHANQDLNFGGLVFVGTGSSVSASNIDIQSRGVIFAGTLATHDLVNGTITITPNARRTIGIDGSILATGGVSDGCLLGCDITFVGSELANISAGKLIFGDDTTNFVFVNAVDAVDSQNIGSLELNALSDQGSITFSGNPSTFNGLLAFADNGIDVEVDLTTTIGDLVLNGDFNGSADGRDNIVIADEITLTSAANLTLKSQTGKISSFDTTLEAGGLISILDDFTVMFDFPPGGQFELIGRDLALFGELSVLSGEPVFISSPNGGSIGLTGELISPDAPSLICGGVQCGMTITNEELRNISTASLSFIFVGVSSSVDDFGGSVFVDGIDGAGINLSLSALNPDGEITFNGLPLTFDRLSASAANGIDVNVDLTTEVGDLTLDGDSDGLPHSNPLTADDSIALTGLRTLTSAGNLSLSSETGGISGDANVILEAGDSIFIFDEFTSSSLTVLADVRVDINADLTTIAGDLMVNGGGFTVGSGVTVSGSNIDIFATGVGLLGRLETLDPMNGVISIASSQQFGSVEVNGFLSTVGSSSMSCDGRTCNISLNASELSNIKTGMLVLGGPTTSVVFSGNLFDPVHSQDIGRVELNALEQGGKIILGQSTFFNTLVANADSGVQIAGNVTTKVGDLIFDGDFDNALDLDGSFKNDTITLADFAESFTLTAGTTPFTPSAITLDATTGGIDVRGLTLNATSDITINDDFTSSGFLSFNADSDGDGSGDFTVASGATISTTGSAPFGIGISIGASDLILLGNLETIGSDPVNSIQIFPTLEQTVGLAGLGVDTTTLCGGNPCGMTITGDELSRINTVGLFLGSGAEATNPANVGTYVDNISVSDTSGIRDLYLLSPGSLHFVNNPSAFGSGLFAMSFLDINVNVDLTFQQPGDFKDAFLFPAGVSAPAGLLVADYNFPGSGGGDGVGDLNIATGANVSTNDFDLWIRANDIDLQGTLNSGSGKTIVLISDHDTIGLSGPGVNASTLCGGVSCGMTLEDSELQNITASGLDIGRDPFGILFWPTDNGDIFVNGVSSASLASAGSVALNARADGASIHFNGNESTFPSLTASADGSINVNTDLTTDTGGILLLANRDKSPDVGGDALEFTGIRSIASAGAIELSAPFSEILANGTMIFNADEGITINDDFTSSGFLSFRADFDGDGNGPFTVASGATITTTGSAPFSNGIGIGASDLHLLGSLQTIGTDTLNLVQIFPRLFKTLGVAGAGVNTTTLCGGNPCGMTITSDELRRINTRELLLGTFDTPNPANAEMYVDNISVADTSTFRDLSLGSPGTLHFVNNPSTFGSGLFVQSFLDINVNVDLTFQQPGDFKDAFLFPDGVSAPAGFLAADFGAGSVNGDGVGNLNIASGATVSTNGFDLWIRANDIDLQGTLNSGLGKTILLISDQGTMGLSGPGVDTSTLCGGVSCGMTLEDSELQNITASSLDIGLDPFGILFGPTENGDLYVNGLSSASLTNASTLNLFALSDQGSITFSGNPSTFNGLRASADNGIDVEVNISTFVGDLFLDGDVNRTFDGDPLNPLPGDDAITFSDGVILSSVGSTTLRATTGGLIGQGDLRLGGFDDVSILSDLTVQKTLTLLADDNAVGGGNVVITDVAEVFADQILIKADDLHLFGTLKTVTGSFDSKIRIGTRGGTLGLTGEALPEFETSLICGGPCSMTITDEELSRMQVGSSFRFSEGLIEFVGSAIFIDDVSSFKKPLVDLFARGKITFGVEKLGRAKIPELTFPRLNASAFNGIVVNTDLTTTIGGTTISGLSLHGDDNRTSDGDPLNPLPGDDAITFIDGITLTSADGLSLRASTGGLISEGDLTLVADGDVTIGSDFTTPSVLVVRSDKDLNVNDGQVVSAKIIQITANDLDLFGFLEAPTISIATSDGGTIGLTGKELSRFLNSQGLLQPLRFFETSEICGTFCGMTITGEELSHMQASRLEIGDSLGVLSGDIFVDGISAADSRVILNALSDQGSITFSGNPSTFNGLEAFAENGIDVNTDLTSAESIFLRVFLDNSSDVDDGITFGDGVTLISDGIFSGIQMLASKDSIAGNGPGIIGEGDLTLVANAGVQISNGLAIQGNLIVRADNDSDGLGLFRGGSEGVSAAHIDITASGLVLDTSFSFPTLVSSSSIVISSSTGGTIGLTGGGLSSICDGPCGMTITQEELSGMQAATGITLQGGDIFVDDIARGLSLFATADPSSRIILGVGSNSLEINGGLAANANNGIDVNTDLRGSYLSLNGDYDNMFNGNNSPLTGGDSIRFLRSTGITLESNFGSIDLRATTGGIFSLGDLTLEANEDVTIASDFTHRVTPIDLVIRADEGADDTGRFIVTSGTDISARSIDITTSDLSLFGSLTADTISIGASRTRVSTFDDKIGLTGGELNRFGLPLQPQQASLICGGSCFMTITGDELSRIQADLLVLGGPDEVSDIFVNGISQANSSGVDNVFLIATKEEIASFEDHGSITFSGNESKFNSLTAVANNGIDVNTSLTTAIGALFLDGDIGNTDNGNDTITFSAGVTLTSAGGMDLEATTGGLIGLGDLTLVADDNVRPFGDLTVQGTLTIRADDDGNGGNFISPNTSVVIANRIDITSRDLLIFGSLSASTISIASSNGGTMALTGEALAEFQDSSICGTLCGMTITDVELSRMQAASSTSFSFFGGSIFVDDVSSFNASSVKLFATADASSRVTLGVVKVGRAITPALNFRSLNANADNGIDVNGDLTTTVGDLFLDGDNGNTFNGNDTPVIGGDSIRFKPGVTLTSFDDLNLLATTGGLIGQGDLKLAASDSVFVDDDMTVQGDLVIRAGTGFLSNGRFRVANTSAISADLINITAADLILSGSLASSSTIAITTSDGGTVGLDGELLSASQGSSICGGSCGMTISGEELIRMQASRLEIGDPLGVRSGDIFVDGVSGADSFGLDRVVLNARSDQGSISFSGNPSTFKRLDAFADNGIDVKKSLTTTDFSIFLDGDSNRFLDGDDTIMFSAGVTLTSAGGIDLRATTGGFIGQGDLTLLANDNVRPFDDLTVQRTLTIRADQDGNGGKFIVLSTSDVFANRIDITASDLSLFGSLESASTILIKTSNGGTIGLTGEALAELQASSICGVLPTNCGMTITGDELSRMQANQLTLVTVSGVLPRGIFVNGISQVDSLGVGQVILSAISDQGSISFSGNPSTFNSLSARADNGIDVKRNLTTVIGDLFLDGNNDNAVDGNDGITFSAGVTLASAGSLTLGQATGGLIGQGSLTLLADNSVNIDDDLTVQGTLTIRADDNDTGFGELLVVSTADVSASFISLKVSDLSLFGSLQSLTAMVITASDRGTIGLTGEPLSVSATSSICGGPCGMTITGLELRRMHASQLVLGSAGGVSSGNIFVDGISAAESFGVGRVTLSATSRLNGITFSGNPSTFFGLSANASNGIDVNTDLTTTSRFLTLNGDFDNTVASRFGGDDAITFASGVTVTAGTVPFTPVTMTLSATTGGIIGLGGLTLNATSDIRINNNISVGTVFPGRLTINADSDGDGLSDFILPSGVTINTNGNPLSITANDVFLDGTIDTGIGDITFQVSDGGTIGLIGTNTNTGPDVDSSCSGLNCDFMLAGIELANITTSGILTIGDTQTTGDTTVEGITAEDSGNLTGEVELNTGGTATFEESASTFSDLTVNANEDVNIMTDVTTTGDFSATADADGSGDGAVAVETDTTIASSGEIVLDGSEVVVEGELDGEAMVAGPLVLTFLDGIIIDNNITATDTVTIVADSDRNGVGDFDLLAGISIVSDDNDVSITANDFLIDGIIKTGNATTILLISDGGKIGVGTATCGNGCGMTIDRSELQRISGNLTIGGDSNGTIEVSGVQTVDVTNIPLLSLLAQRVDAVIKFTDKVSTFNGLLASAGDSIKSFNEINAGSMDLSAGMDVIFNEEVYVENSLTASAGRHIKFFDDVNAGSMDLNAGMDVLFDDSVTVVGDLTATAGRDIKTFKEVIAGTIELSADNHIKITKKDITTTTGDFIAIADADNDGSGFFKTTKGATISSAGDISITGFGVFLDEPLSAGGTIELNDTSAP